MLRNSVCAHECEGLGLTGCQLGDYAISCTEDLATFVVERGLQRGTMLDGVVVGCLSLHLSAVSAGYEIGNQSRPLLICGVSVLVPAL
jgi:hypothetical protein